MLMETYDNVKFSQDFIKTRNIMLRPSHGELIPFHFPVVILNTDLLFVLTFKEFPRIKYI